MSVPDLHSLVVAGQALRPPSGVDVTNFHCSSVEGFKTRSREGRTVNELILHETVNRSVETTVAVLRQKGYGVHLIVDADGSVTQHGDLQYERLSHAGGHNGPSVGIEVVAPYYPSLLKPSDPWKRVIDAPWAHRGLYVVPTFEQAEACAKLTAWLSSDKAGALRIARTWIGYDGGELAMGRVSGAAEHRRAGIYAHCHFHHADGLFLVLYAWLRIEAGLPPSRAYEEAINRATGARVKVDVSDLDPGVAA
jgi:hypothetical protein